MLVSENVFQFMTRLRNAWRHMCLPEVALALGQCPFCGPSAFIRLRADEIGVRCVRCLATAVHMSFGFVLRKDAGQNNLSIQRVCPSDWEGEWRPFSGKSKINFCQGPKHVPNLGTCDVCELSARGPLATHLVRHARKVALSEYFTDTATGTVRDGVRCEDVQRLTYADASFDVITHTEVLEHVPDDSRALVELRRVLRPGGVMLFTVPLHDGVRTIERARLLDGRVTHLRPPAYHRDPLRSGAGILAFRDYGTDIIERVQAAGFTHAWIESPSQRLPWGYGRAVVVAHYAEDESVHYPCRDMRDGRLPR